MRKLVVLKSVVDFIWILTCIPLIPLILFFVIMVFTGSNVIKIIQILDLSGGALMGWPGKIAILIGAIVALINIYCVYLFRKTLRYFQRVRPFHIDVIKNFEIIGKLMCYSGLVSLILSVVFTVYFRSTIKINFGFSPYLFITALGLFFMVLSEVFRVAKRAKEENELTI